MFKNISFHVCLEIIPMCYQTFPVVLSRGHSWMFMQEALKQILPFQSLLQGKTEVCVFFRNLS